MTYTYSYNIFPHEIMWPIFISTGYTSGNRAAWRATFCVTMAHVLSVLNYRQKRSAWRYCTTNI